MEMTKLLGQFVLYEEIWNMEIQGTRQSVHTSSQRTLLLCFQLLFGFAPFATVEFLHLYLIKEFLHLTYKCVVMQVYCFITIALYWHNYERFKKMLCKEVGVHEPTFFIAFTSGVASGSVSMFLFLVLLFIIITSKLFKRSIILFSQKCHMF